VSPSLEDGLDDGGRSVNLSIITEIVDEVRVIHAMGEIDVYTAPSLQAKLSEIIEGGHDLVLDLTQVHFIDSTGLGVLVGSLQRAQNSSSGFRLVLDDPYLLKIFHVTGFDGVFSIYPQVSDAIYAS
jgi:anti-sigma B factor antagonist